MLQDQQEAHEPTSTIVLTSQTSHFVDIRLFQDALDSFEQHPNQDDASPILEWAFAGTSTSHPSAEDGSRELSNAHHSVWEHWIDSRTRSPCLDQGDLYTLPDGNVLEKGTQLDPVTGVEVQYEELWEDYEVLVVGKEEKRVSMVVKLDDSDGNVRGLIVRVGQYCQAILQEGDKLTVERWEWKRRENGGSWKRLVRIGHALLPCDRATTLTGFGNQAVQSGDWRVMEDHCW